MGLDARVPGVGLREFRTEEDDQRRVIDPTTTTTSEPAAPNGDPTAALAKYSPMANLPKEKSKEVIPAPSQTYRSKHSNYRTASRWILQLICGVLMRRPRIPNDQACPRPVSQALTTRL